MHRTRSATAARIVWLLLLTSSGACSQAGDKPAVDATGGSAASGPFDLSAMPLFKPVEEANYRKPASLSYNGTGSTKDAYEFQRKYLVENKWQEQPGTYLDQGMASGTFTRDGYRLSVGVFPLMVDDVVTITITNHGNVDFDKLPLPSGATPLFKGPVSSMFATEAPAEATAEVLRAALVEKGWQPYGSAGDVQYFKLGKIRLSARVAVAPAQGGKTVIDYSSMLMSADLPAPPDAEQLQYSDAPTQLFFDSPRTKQEVVDDFRQELAKAGWEPTTEGLIQDRFRGFMIFRNPPMDLLHLDITEVDGKTRVLLNHQTAAEVADIERRIDEETELKKKAKQAP